LLRPGQVRTRYRPTNDSAGVSGMGSGNRGARPEDRSTGLAVRPSANPVVRTRTEVSVPDPPVECRRHEQARYDPSARFRHPPPIS
jgi:hypothetical protein